MGIIAIGMLARNPKVKHEIELTKKDLKNIIKEKKEKMVRYWAILNA